uniref:Uncharacterized protein n=1 Tax=Arundo donax TaxID=35708 RepID=A0A0A9T7W7_ARUDO
MLKYYSDVCLHVSDYTYCVLCIILVYQEQQKSLPPSGLENLRAKIKHFLNMGNIYLLQVFLP